MMDILASCRMSSPDDGSHDLHARCLSAAGKIEELVAERDRLRAALKTANEQTEMFERRYYLRGDALEWYADEAKALAMNLQGEAHTSAHTSAVLATLTVLALDAGRRADEALKA